MWSRFRRWVRNLKPSVKDDQQRTVTDDHVTAPAEPSPGHTPTNEVDYRVWIPGAENVHQTEGIKQKTRGEYADGYPQGIVIHWDAGWALDPGNYWNPFPRLQTLTTSLDKMARKRAIGTMRLGEQNGHLYMAMDVLGRIYQSRPLTKWGYHAGKSFYPGLGYSVSNQLCGIEVKCPGKVTKKGEKFVTWYGQEFDGTQVRWSDGKDNIAKGWYVMYSREQEDMLVDLCCKLWIHSPEIDGSKVFKIKYIVGHDSVSPGRKTDPGASLSVSITEFRELVKSELMKRGYQRGILI